MPLNAHLRLPFLLATFALAAGASSGKQASSKPPDTCKDVRARYAIYVERDGLWVLGSKHLLEITNDKLDGLLEKAGWQDHVLFGDFTICSPGLSDPLNLTNHSDVTIRSYKNIQLRHR